MSLSYDKAHGILSSLGRKLDRDVRKIDERLNDICDRLSRIEKALLEPSSETQTVTVNYDPEGAWTSTVLFKDKEEELNED